MPISAEYRVRINLDNAAFEEPEAPMEVARILRKLADGLENSYMLDTLSLFDINGNKVGKAECVQCVRLM